MKGKKALASLLALSVIGSTLSSPYYNDAILPDETQVVEQTKVKRRIPTTNHIDGSLVNRPYVHKDKINRRKRFKKRYGKNR